MKIGVPKEIKPQENRIGLTPDSVKILISNGHEVLVENNGGFEAGFYNEQYKNAGAKIIDKAEDIFNDSEIIVKVKEPLSNEVKMIRENQIIFTYLHLAAAKELTEGLIKSKAVCIAYETVTDDNGRLPLLAPMSAVAGRMSIQAGAHSLEKNQKGRGLLLGGAPGVDPAKVVILGGGVVGENAALIATGMRAKVHIVDKSEKRLEQLKDMFGDKIIPELSGKTDLKKLVSRKDKYGKYAWSVISKIILYASSLIPNVTKDHNNIDEAMRLGFNWTKGPFEMLEELGVKFFVEKDSQLKTNKFIKELYDKKVETFYGKRQIYTNLETLGKVKQLAKINRDNKSAITYEHKNYKIVEFNTKANTLDYDSMDALKKASDKNLIIINEGMQFSAGVNLNYVMDFAKEKNWKSIEKFIHHFQMTCKQLKYSNNLVISAPSGLALGGGFEVLVQSDYVVAHTNIVTGLVETLVGLIPAGGGTTNMLWRWIQTQEVKKDHDFAPQKVFDIIGYGKTASSPTEALPFKFLLEKDKSIMNRNKLLSASQDLINEKKDGYKPPKQPTFKLSGGQVRDKMFQTLENLFKEKKILEHGMEVGKKLAFVLSGGNTTIDKELSEDDMYALELEAFVQLIQMEKTQARIRHTLSTGKPLMN